MLSREFDPDCFSLKPPQDLEYVANVINDKDGIDMRGEGHDEKDRPEEPAVFLKGIGAGTGVCDNGDDDDEEKEKRFVGNFFYNFVHFKNGTAG